MSKRSAMMALFFYLLFAITPRLVADATTPSILGPTRKAYTQVPANTTYTKKPVTVLLYGSARNDLMPFIDRNLTQLMQIGSNGNITFLIHLDIFGNGRKKLTRRFIVQKGTMLQVGDDMSMDSGDPATLIDACRWAFGNFPSDMTILVLWNHGTGDREPSHGRQINPSELFTYNPNTRLIELNRSLEFLEYITAPQQKEQTMRGICFDEATGHFITNSQVGKALEHIRNTVLNGKPFDIILSDACLMHGIGWMSSLKHPKKTPIARYIVGSQEVVLATGYPYTHLFAKIATQPMNCADFCSHVVQAFHHTYNRITNDYTQSAIWLEEADRLYETVDKIAKILTFGMHNEQQKSVRNLIQYASARERCTYFEEPTYKDLHHFCTNLLTNLANVKLTNEADTTLFKQHLTQQVNKLQDEMNTIVIANATGANLRKARGISIYIPEKQLDHSYSTTDFAKNNSWFAMIKEYSKHK